MRKLIDAFEAWMQVVTDEDASLRTFMDNNYSVTVSSIERGYGNYWVIIDGEWFYV